MSPPATPSPLRAPQRASALALAGLLLLILTACAGEARAQSLSRERWIERADAICARADDETHALGDATTLEELAGLTDATERVVRRQLAELRALRPRPAEAASVNEILEGLARVNAALGDLRRAAASGSWSRVDAAGRRVLALSKKADRLVSAYGLQECLSDDG
jgi:hypothetical protein